MLTLDRSTSRGTVALPGFRSLHSAQKIVLAPSLRRAFLLLMGLSTALLAGCGATAIQSAAPLAKGVALPGMVHGGQQPVAGARIYLYAAGSAGPRSSALSLLSTSSAGVSTDTNGNGYVLTNANGGFDITSDWSCVNASDQVYVLALGGNPGLAAGTDNAALALITGLGTCSALLAQYPFISVNEVTTVATVWALQQFMGDVSHIGASSTNALGLANAFSQIPNLVNIATGTSLLTTPGGNGAVPQAKLNTLGNMIAPCVNSLAASSSVCAGLIAMATPAGTTPPTDTVRLALAIAQNPASNVTALFGMVPAAPPFLPELASAPTDWMIPVSFTGGGLQGPSSVAVDASGNLWVGNYSGVVSSFSTVGLPITKSGYSGSGLVESYGLAIDIAGNIWTASEETRGGINQDLGTVTELNASGQPLSGSTGFIAGGIYFPIAVTADPNGNMWVVDYGDSKVTLLNPSGTPLSSPGGWGGNALSFPFALAVDSNHNAWVANQSSNTITRISADGTSVLAVSCCNGASGVATDQQNNVWATNYYGNSISEVSPSGVVLQNSIAGGGLLRPLGIAIDGGGTIWATSYRGSTLSELSGSLSANPGTVLSPSTGFGTDAALSEPYGIALDASGNLWVSNSGSSTITQFIGVASPIRTPFAGPPSSP